MRRHLLAPSSEGVAPIPIRIWSFREVVAVPRALCLYAELDRRAVPFAQLRNFLNLQMVRISPFESSQSHIEIGHQLVRVWYWDANRLSKLVDQRRTRAWFIPETCLLATSKSALIVCPLGGFEGRDLAPLANASPLRWWPSAPSASQWAEFSAAPKPIAVRPSWRAALAIPSLLGAAWWQREPADRAPQSWNPLFLAAALSVAGVAALVGFRGFQLAQAAEQQQSLLSEARTMRQAAFQQIQSQNSLSALAEQSKGLGEFSKQSDVAQSMACLGLSLSGTGLSLREVDIRAGTLQAQLASISAIDLTDAQLALNQCALLQDATVEPTSETKMVRLSASLIAKSGASAPAAVAPTRSPKL